MSETDSAGNYFFEVFQNKYKIFPITWRDKRILRGKMSKVLTSEGELDPFSEGFFDLQDYVLTKVDHISENGPVKLNSPEAIENHFVAISVDVLDGVDTVFNEALSYLAGNFIYPAAELSDPVNSTADAGDSSKSQSTQQQLSGMLKE